MAGFVGDMVVIVVATLIDRVQAVLALLGIRRKGQIGLTGSYGGRYDAEGAVDHDNQLIDDIEDDRW